MTLHVHDDVAQGTDEWHALRRGLVTASTVGKLLTVGAPGATAYECPRCSSAPDHPCISLTKKTPTPIKTVHPERAAVAVEKAPTAEPVVSVADNDTSRALTATLVAERITGFTEDTPISSDMWRGIESEPVARDLYGVHHAPAVEVGFMRLEEDWGTLGYSPDGLVGDDGLIEVKAPRAKSQIQAVLNGEVPTQHLAQCQAGLLVSGRKWLDFIPYVGGLPLWTVRVTPDPAWHAAIVAAVTAFEKTAAEMVAAYKTKTEGLPATERVVELEMSL